MGFLKAYGKWIVVPTILLAGVLSVGTAAAFNTAANRAVFVGGGVTVENLQNADDWIEEGRNAVSGGAPAPAPAPAEPGQ